MIFVAVMSHDIEMGLENSQSIESITKLNNNEFYEDCSLIDFRTQTVPIGTEWLLSEPNLIVKYTKIL
jgi:hypothetical protein